MECHDWKVRHPRAIVISIYTIGHSTRSEQEFLKLLHAHKISLLVDVRKIPRSARNPQFNKDSLAAALPRAGIQYQHEEELGGLRRPLRKSQNLGWKNEGFRGFADYMQTQQFELALERLIQRSSANRTTILCAEAFYVRCHRRLISDALTARGIEVLHIISVKDAKPHVLTDFAQVQNGRVTYPANQTALDFS